MSKKNQNPYVRGNYKALFAFWQKSQVLTRKAFEAYAVGELKMSEAGAKASVGVMLSPCESSERGDCRGNFSAEGHLYFGERLKKSGEETKYRLRWRKDALEVFKRKAAVKPAKVKKAKANKGKVTKKITKVSPKAKAPKAPATVEAPVLSEIIPA